MKKRVTIQRNRYVDSVTLMDVRDKAMGCPGVRLAEVQMGTPANLRLMREMGFVVDEDVGCNDLVCGIDAENDAAADAAMGYIDDLLERKTEPDAERFSDLDEIDLTQTPYDLVQISLPGEYVYAEAKKALEKGLDVFIFSDGVSLEEELALKREGHERGLLVMGPDCGVGLIDGVALAAGSIVRRGEIGIVGASGSGAQEVACLIERCGCGVSAIIGTGGRDLFPQIGGIAMLDGMERLAGDPNTKVIVLVSKLADADVMEKVLRRADQIEKPVVAVFIGGGEELFKGHRVIGAEALETAALAAVEALCGARPSWGCDDGELDVIAGKELAMLAPEQRYFRGLFCGGTFAEESLVYFSRHNAGAGLRSNLENRYAARLDDPEVSVGNTILDLGAENFTARFPHPVFDSRIRMDRLKKEMADPQVAVVMMDFITGPGVDGDPFAPVAALVRESRAGGRHVSVIASICGSEADPQNVREMARLLRDSGVIVTGSNYQSAKLASRMMSALERRG